MNALARNVFNDGKRDVERYFEFIKATVDAPAPFGETIEQFEHRTHLYKILKANAVLVLYNLVESSVTNALIALYTEINLSQADFVRLTEQLKNAWIQYEVRNISKGEPSESAVFQYVKGIVVRVANTEKVKFPLESKAIRLSGNVDADQIRKVAHEHGFDHVTRTNGEGSNLRRVKIDRNRLAHGLTSFSECGRVYSVLELEGIKNQVLLYLEKIIENVEDFADSRSYLVT